MIQSKYKNYRKTFLSVAEGPVGFEIQLGNLKDPQAFEKGETILITGKNPNLLWDLLYEYIGLPYPKLNPKPTVQENSSDDPGVQPVVPDPAPKAVAPKSPLEETLRSLSSKEIVEKVARETGVGIYNSLKSKAAIIKKALKIYGEKNII
jgi:hypothetical protein